MRASIQPITTTLVALCVGFFLAVGLDPELRNYVGDRAPDPMVRLLSAPFVHGFSRDSILPHLTGNMVLLLVVGTRVEQLLGPRRFSILTISALLAYGAIQSLLDFEVNGASVFIWAYAPPFAVAHFHRSRTISGGWIVLFIMWVAIPIAMTGIPLANGFDGGVFCAFLVANVFHLSATATGIVLALFWTRDLRKTSRYRSP